MHPFILRGLISLYSLIMTEPLHAALHLGAGSSHVPPHQVVGKRRFVRHLDVTVVEDAHNLLH